MKIGLDAGHGLKTAGKQTPTGIKEWELNDKVRDKVVELLKNYDVSFVFTDNNEGLVDEDLTARRIMYVNQDVDAFVSIHHNAFTGSWNDATGVETYTDRNYTEADERLAKAIHKNLASYIGIADRGIKRANFTVINQNKVPAILIEGGFMDSKIDYPIITSDEGQNAYARAIAEGLISFLELKENQDNNNDSDNRGSDEPVRRYVNGSTPEPVYSNLQCTNKIGSLNPRESCDCFGEFNGKAMVRYKVDGKNDYKIGFCKWLGGIK